MFRFTIRELILLTIIVAMGGAWFFQRLQAIDARSRLSVCQFQLEWLVSELQVKGYQFSEYRYIDPPLPQADRLPSNPDKD